MIYGEKIMKREIRFDITVGSVLKEPEFPGQIDFPTGGKGQEIVIEFDSDNNDPMNDAFKALKEKMGNTSYHVWYWTWLK